MVKHLWCHPISNLRSDPVGSGRIRSGPVGSGRIRSDPVGLVFFWQGENDVAFWVNHILWEWSSLSTHQAATLNNPQTNYNKIGARRVIHDCGQQMQESIKETPPIFAQIDTNSLKRRKLEGMLQNAGKGSYQALQKAPQSRIDPMHKAHGGRAKGPKTARNWRVFA